MLNNTQAKTHRGSLWTAIPTGSAVQEFEAGSQKPQLLTLFDTNSWALLFGGQGLCKTDCQPNPCITAGAAVTVTLVLERVSGVGSSDPGSVQLFLTCKHLVQGARQAH